LFDPRTPPERLAEVVRRLGLLGGGGIVVLPGAEVSSIRQGVLFVMATWSVQALSSFRHLNDVLSRLDLDGLKVFVADIDALTSGFDRLARGLVLGGYGETFWIRGGEVQYALSHCSPKLAGLVEQFTWAILAEGAHDPQE
jgi:hypothetical protein